MALEKYRLENLPPTTQTAIVAAVSLGLAAAVYFVYVRGLVTERSALRTEVQRLEASVSQLSSFAEKLAQNKREVAELESRLQVLKKILPDQKETPVILRSVQEMAYASNLKISKFDPQPVVTRAFYSDWPIAMELTGSYNALGEFFEKIGRAARIINVSNISLKGIDGSIDPARTVNATCTATTFVFREEAVQPTTN
ncbi:MAG: type 4a pilus biogenesis protein PilO [Acidobacteria bacterium]|nr:type 4a pilus biogenesis protein PilO [Acidobacteriota bacterium]